MKVNRALAFSIFVTRPHLNVASIWPLHNTHPHANVPPVLEVKLSTQQSCSPASPQLPPLKQPLLQPINLNKQSSDDDLETTQGDSGRYLSPDKVSEMNQWVDCVYNDHIAQHWLLGNDGAPDRDSIFYGENTVIPLVYNAFDKYQQQMKPEFENQFREAIKQLSQLPAKSHWDLAIIADYFQMLGHITGVRKSRKSLSNLEIQNRSTLTSWLRQWLTGLLEENPRVDILLSALETQIRVVE